ncbi:nitrous oxide reductase accessory protein NosL [Arcobacter lacus]|uniref:NosL domain-containing protein n=1 Tax=Arcobacter lacus TaxID=1912876 RepID=A0ABX5JJ96_9BACT|nr:nitrous oxide reductase accessory protein NosL [Arcobacter lacus]PUE67445.1 hypothetical protein B0175_00230 [Arcobacter lacus]
MKKSILFMFVASLFTSLNAHDMMSHSTHMEETSKKIDVKQTLVAKKGKKIFEEMCDKNQIKDFNSQDEAKDFLTKNSICKNLDEDKIEAVTLYLSNPILANDKSQIIDVPKDAKCPVCGMYVSKYPKWVAKISAKDENSYYFDGVKDMLKFYFNPSKYSKNEVTINEITVTDYYSLESINAKNAYFVTDSNVYGPMGKEIIPFKDENQAKKFMQDHSGKKVLKFEELDKTIIE